MLRVRGGVTIRNRFWFRFGLIFWLRDRIRFRTLSLRVRYRGFRVRYRYRYRVTN